VSLNAKQAKLFRLALVSAPPLPKFVASAPAGGNNFTFSGGNGIPGWAYSVLASRNLALPVSQWPVVATNLFDADGNFSFTNGPGLNAPRQFYLLKLQ
jgi:hypothetical protein